MNPNSIQRDDMLSNMIVSETSLSSIPNGSSGSVGVSPYGSSDNGGGAPLAHPEKQKPRKSGKPYKMGKRGRGIGGLFRRRHKF